MSDRPIFVISDLHIGDGGPRDNFSHGGQRPKQLEKFLDYVAGHNGELIIVGDLLDFWQASFSRVVVKNKKLIDRLGQTDATYVVGNHDIDLVSFIDDKLLSPALFQRLSGPFTRKIGGKTFKFMHGHEVDPFNAGDTPSWGRMMAIFAGICEDKVGSPMLQNEPLESILTRIGEWFLKVVADGYAKFKGPKTKSAKEQLTPAQNRDRAAEMLAKYAADRQAESYDVAIVGHTHEPGQIGDWYFNTGSWATTNNNFVRIDPDGQAALFDWIDGQPVPNDTVLNLPKSPNTTETVSGEGGTA